MGPSSALEHDCPVPRGWQVSFPNAAFGTLCSHGGPVPVDTGCHLAGAGRACK